MRRHHPAMLQEVLEWLQISRGDIVLDGTIGHGGHAEKMLEAAGPDGKLIGFDWDLEMLNTAEQNLEATPGTKLFVNADYRHVPQWVPMNQPGGIDAILLDFGVNLNHFENPERGFSFNAEAPLDMRMDRQAKETASAWLNRASEGEIAMALRNFGDEKWAGPIAKQIVKFRKESSLKTTTDLVTCVLRAVPPAKREKRIHPATRTFQAIRIVVNEELNDLQDALQAIARTLKPGGRMVTLSYHSGEDAAAKNAFRELARSSEFAVLTKKPVRPSEAEISENPSARSARLRAIQRTEKT